MLTLGADGLLVVITPLNVPGVDDNKATETSSGPTTPFTGGMESVWLFNVLPIPGIVTTNGGATVICRSNVKPLADIV
jgi:hypothetical protein